MLPRPSKSHNPVRRVKSNPDPSKLQNSMVDIDEAMEVKSPDEKKSLSTGWTFELKGRTKFKK